MRVYLQQTLEEELKTVFIFSDFAGPKLNLQKTEGLLLGPLKHSSIKSCNNIEFKDSPIKCLGIYIGHDKEKCEELIGILKYIKWKVY